MKLLKEKVRITIDSDILEKIRIAAEEDDRSLSQYINIVLKEHVKHVEKNKKCYFNFEKRKQLLEAIRYVDLVIPENTWDQKISDIKEYHIDTFVIGNDWEGKFDFLKDFCNVVYLQRTPEISTTQKKNDLYLDK